MEPRYRSIEPVKPKNYDWLDKIINEQAASYGLSVEKHRSLVSEVAEYQEQIESGIVEEPTS